MSDLSTHGATERIQRDIRRRESDVVDLRTFASRDFDAQVLAAIDVVMARLVEESTAGRLTIRDNCVLHVNSLDNLPRASIINQDLENGLGPEIP